VLPDLLPRGLREKKNRLFLGERHLGQNRQFDHILGLFDFFTRVHRLAVGTDQAGGDEDDQVSFDVLIEVGGRETTPRTNVLLRAGVTPPANPTSQLGIDNHTRDQKLIVWKKTVNAC
jgi:hypothetical protein